MDYITPARLRVTDDHNVFFTSDTHFGHNKEFLYGKRGYASVIEHDADIIDKWNKKITNHDTVFHCGDFMFGDGGLERLENYFNNLNFRYLYIMPGNHHAGIKQFIAKHGHGQIYGDSDVVKEVHIVPNYIEIFVNGQAIVLCHYPIASWNGMAHGSWCVCGHTHGSYVGSQKTNLDGKILDVGIEVVGEPVSAQEIYVIMETKTIKIVDHHNKDTKNPF